MPFYIFAQNKKDTTIKVDGKLITLAEVVINSRLNVPSFIERVKNDTTFYKAFRNLHILNYTAINDIRMVDKRSEVIASQDKANTKWRLPDNEGIGRTNHRGYL